MNKLVAFGLVLVVLGILGFPVPFFTTQHTENVASLGNVRLQTTESHEHSIPPLLAGGVFVIGLLLTGVGLSRRP